MCHIQCILFSISVVLKLSQINCITRIIVLFEKKKFVIFPVYVRRHCNHTTFGGLILTFLHDKDKISAAFLDILIEHSLVFSRIGNTNRGRKWPVMGKHSHVFVN